MIHPPGFLACAGVWTSTLALVSAALELEVAKSSASAGGM